MGVNNYIYKSGIYQKAAELLDKSSMYTAVPHCAYYSCLLYMQYIRDKAKKAGVNVTNRKIRKRHGLHEVLINQVGVLIRNNNQKDFQIYSSKICQLKRLRVEADYKDVPVDVNKSKDSIDLAKDILPVLKKI